MVHLGINSKPKICLIHGKEINHKKGSLINKRVIKVLSNVDKIVANSKFTKNLACEKGLNPEIKTHLEIDIENEFMKNRIRIFFFNCFE